MGGAPREPRQSERGFGGSSIGRTTNAGAANMLEFQSGLSIWVILLRTHSCVAPEYSGQATEASAGLIVTILIKNALEGAQFMKGLPGAVRGTAVELERANRLDDQTLDDIEHRAIRKLKEQAFDGDARAEESEQVRLDRGRAPGRDIDLFSALVRRYRVQEGAPCSQSIQ